jgi:hypothetical protein
MVDVGQQQVDLPGERRPEADGAVEGTRAEALRRTRDVDGHVQSLGFLSGRIY